MHEFKTVKIRTSSVVKHLYYKQEGLASIPKVGNKSFTFTTLNTAYKEHLKKFYIYIYMYVEWLWQFIIVQNSG
jgi:hypothetical protein